MTQFQNSSVVFRCPESLKEKMKAHAFANELYLSAFIRMACADRLEHEQSQKQPPMVTSADIEKRLQELQL